MAGAERRLFPWRFTAPLLLAASLNPINSSMLATGLADISADFAVTPGAAATLVSVLYLCSAVAQPAIGKLGAVFGQRRIFLIGLAVVVVGGLVGAFAFSFSHLLASRALIGIGTSAAFPTALALVRARADRTEAGVPTRVIGSLSIAAQVSLVVGLPLGGVLTGLFGWRALFAVNVPLALAALVAVWIWVERDVGARPDDSPLGQLDLLGIVLFSTAIASLVLFLDDLFPPRWVILAVAAVAAVLLVLWERRSRSPLIDVRLLIRRPALARVYLRQAVTGLTVFTALYGLSQWMGTAAGIPPATAGLILLPLSLVSVVLARFVSVRGWVRGPLIGGAAAVVVAGVMLTVLGSSSSGLVTMLLVTATLYGVAHGLTTVATQTALYIQSSAHDLGTAAGLLRSSGYVGAILSASVISVTFGEAPSDAGLHLQGWIIVGLGGALLALAWDRALPWTVRPRSG